MIPKSIQFVLIVSLICVLSCKDEEIPTEPKGSFDAYRIYKIAFLSKRDLGYRYQIYMMDSDGKNQKNNPKLA